jgi:hypothetical protein
MNDRHLLCPESFKQLSRQMLLPQARQAVLSAGK